MRTLRALCGKDTFLFAVESRCQGGGTVIDSNLQGNRSKNFNL